MAFPYVMLLSLLVTIIVELLVAFVIKIHNKKDILNIILVNIITNPLLVSIMYVIFLKYGRNVQTILEIILEVVILVVEGMFYRKYLKYNKINPFLISFILNIFSYILGSWLIDIICKHITIAFFT